MSHSCLTQNRQRCERVHPSCWSLEKMEGLKRIYNTPFCFITCSSVSNPENIIFPLLSFFFYFLCGNPLFIQSSTLLWKDVISVRLTQNSGFYYKNSLQNLKLLTMIIKQQHKTVWREASGDRVAL